MNNKLLLSLALGSLLATHLAPTHAGWLDLLPSKNKLLIGAGTAIAAGLFTIRQLWYNKAINLIDQNGTSSDNTIEDSYWGTSVTVEPISDVKSYKNNPKNYLKYKFYPQNKWLRIPGVTSLTVYYDVERINQVSEES